MAIAGKISMSKIDKAKLYQGRTDTYLDFVLIPTKNSRYGDDYMVVQGVSKSDREKGIKGPILGNARIISSVEHRSAPQGRPAPKKDENVDEDVPF